MLSSGNPKQVLDQATLTPYVQTVFMKSGSWQLNVNVQGDVGQHGFTGGRVGVSADTPIGQVGVDVGVNAPPGEHPIFTVSGTYTPGKKKGPTFDCETTRFEPEFECSQEVTTPAHDVPITVDLPWEPRTHNLYFDYARDIVTSSGNEYGKKHPEIVARNETSIREILKDIGEGFRVSAVAGFTSPEGPMPKGQGGFEGNTALAKKRGAAAVEYIATSGRCVITIEKECFAVGKDAIKKAADAAVDSATSKEARAVKGELYTAFDERGKELEGKELAEKATQRFKEVEESTLTGTEREALAHSRGAMAQAEVIYPLLRRAEITLVRAGTRPVTLWTEHLPGETAPKTVDCPAEVQQAAKKEFDKQDATRGSTTK